MFKKNKAQSTAEYAVVLSLVIAAVIGMQVYIKRGLQAKLKTGTDSLTSAGSGFTFNAVGGAGSAVTISALKQYEPYYQESSYTSYSENVEREHMGDGKVTKEKVSDINARGAGGYQTQRGSDDATERDKTWTDKFGQ